MSAPEVGETYQRALDISGRSTIESLRDSKRGLGLSRCAGRSGKARQFGLESLKAAQQQPTPGADAGWQPACGKVACFIWVNWKHRSTIFAAEKAAGCNLEFSKFDELRTQTDRKLIRIIDNDLDLGIRAARQALNSAGSWTVSAEQSYSRAERAHAEVSRLLPLMYGVARDELDKWEVRLRHLGELLKALAAICSSASRR